MGWAARQRWFQVFIFGTKISRPILTVGESWQGRFWLLMGPLVHSLLIIFPDLGYDGLTLKNPSISVRCSLSNSWIFKALNYWSNIFKWCQCVVLFFKIRWSWYNAKKTCGGEHVIDVFFCHGQDTIPAYLKEKSWLWPSEEVPGNFSTVCFGGDAKYDRKIDPTFAGAIPICKNCQLFFCLKGDSGILRIDVMNLLSNQGSPFFVVQFMVFSTNFWEISPQNCPAVVGVAGCFRMFICIYRKWPLWCFLVGYGRRSFGKDEMISSLTARENMITWCQLICFGCFFVFGTRFQNVWIGKWHHRRSEIVNHALSGLESTWPRDRKLSSTYQVEGYFSNICTGEPIPTRLIMWLHVITWYL